MKNKRKLISVSLLLSMSLISCNQSQNDIGLFIYDGNDTFISYLTGEIKGKISQMGKSCSSYEASRSQRIQNDQIISDLNENYSKVLMVNLVDRLAASSIIQKAETSKKPIIFFNREPLNEDLENDNVYYVGSDPTVEGELQAQMAGELFGNPTSLNPLRDKNGDNKIQVILLKGEQNHQDAENRSKYCIQGLKNVGYDVDILSVSYCDWSRTKGYNAMKSLYAKYGEQIEIVLSNNDDMAVGALDYLIEDKIFSPENEVNEQPFPIIGVDATEVGIKAIKDNLLYGTVKNDASSQADAISTLGKYFLEGTEIDSSFPYTINSNHAIYIRGKGLTKKDL